jgi:predicted aldo/keto reductase-like oxidoreductase
MLFDDIFPLGLGTNRFPINSHSNPSEVDKSVEIVLHALDAGIKYIEVAHTYSKGLAQFILKQAFAQTIHSYCVTVKSKYGLDKTEDDAKKRCEDALVNMGIDHASFFVCWSIMSYDEFTLIMQKGGIYDAAVKLRNEGIINHICFSTHAPVPDIIKILETDAFEGVTLSFSLLNSNVMLPVLDKAQELGIGVAVMNPLGGGVIPQNRDFFSFVCNENENNTVHAALRYIKAHPAINIVLTGPASIQELDENLAAFNGKSQEPDVERIRRVNARLHGLKNFCTGCNYCVDCPQEIPISAIMQSRNTLLFQPVKAYNRDDSELLYNIQLFRKLAMNFSYMPDTPENPCTKCGQCEKKCTQNLNIIDMLDDTYKRMNKVNFSLSGRHRRLEILLHGKDIKKVGFYPSGGYMIFVLELYRKFFGEPKFNYVLFDSNPAMWGKTAAGKEIYPPSYIIEAAPDIILISNYNYDHEIYESIKQFTDNGIEILKLHELNDVPWVF